MILNFGCLCWTRKTMVDSRFDFTILGLISWIVQTQHSKRGACTRIKPIVLFRAQWKHKKKKQIEIKILNEKPKNRLITH